MKITTKALKHYRTVDVIIEDGGSKLERRFYEEEIFQLKEMLEASLEDVNYIIEEVKSKRIKSPLK